ncbi:hypothetical protein, partial [Pseudomonas syringae]|uniref:hypothetical protein n=1 Tax=Pseudomonas syringae TaxID=317 RepID=UPI0019D33F93
GALVPWCLGAQNAIRINKAPTVFHQPSHQQQFERLMGGASLTVENGLVLGRLSGLLVLR